MISFVLPTFHLLCYPDQDQTTILWNTPTQCSNLSIAWNYWLGVDDSKGWIMLSRVVCVVSILVAGRSRTAIREPIILAHDYHLLIDCQSARLKIFYRLPSSAPCYCICVSAKRYWPCQSTDAPPNVQQVRSHGRQLFYDSNVGIHNSNIGVIFKHNDYVIFTERNSVFHHRAILVGDERTAVGAPRLWFQWNASFSFCPCRWG